MPPYDVEGRCTTAVMIKKIFAFNREISYGTTTVKSAVTGAALPALSAIVPW
jgi:hypothetical protein